MARPFRMGMTTHDRSEARRGADGDSYPRDMQTKHYRSSRSSRTDWHRRQVSPPRRLQATADALVSLALELLAKHSLDELRAMRDAATGGEKELLRDVVLIAQYTCKEGH